MVSLLSAVLLLVAATAPCLCSGAHAVGGAASSPYTKGIDALANRRYKTASNYFFEAMFDQRGGHSVDEAFTQLVTSYRALGQEEEAYIRLGELYHRRGRSEHAKRMTELALTVKPLSARAHMLAAEVYLTETERRDATEEQTRERVGHLARAIELAPRDPYIAFRVGSVLWDLKAYAHSEAYNEMAYSLNRSMLDASVFAIYQRNMICKWGADGAQYDEDMRQLVRIARYESTHRHKDMLSSSIQPHMALGFDIPADLKLLVSQSHARAEREVFATLGRHEAMNLATETTRTRREFQASPDSFRIRVGYVSANIKSKTTVYMAQDLLRFHDRSRFEVHVYATTPPDTPRFLEVAMRGIDWRKKVAASVEHFHEVQDLDVFQLHKLIRSHGIHILLNWDGYSNNGVRPTGLFAMQPAPIQIAHQEYIGTVGADYIQYMITDPVASPHRYEQFYSEKFIWLPSSFLATSMAYLQPDMQPPSVDPPHPEKRGCGGAPASFVYCNFNKQLKFDPHVFREWLRILQNVPDSVLCLLENPKDSIPFIESFVTEFDSSLKSRVRFQEFENNPFDNQRRDAELCNVVLDTPRYNGHTTAADNLWAGVPIVTFGNSIEMGGRVGASILSTLGMPELIAMSQDEYNSIAVSLGRDQEHYLTVRAKLVATCLEGSNPFWDLRRYMKNLENGFQIAFFSFLNGRKPAHIRVADAYDNKGWGVSCVQATDGSCSPVEEGTKWPWAETDELDAFYLTSEAAVARDDELNARITPEPVLNYHGVSQADVEEFTYMTLQSVARDEELQRAQDEQDNSVPGTATKQGRKLQQQKNRDRRTKKHNEDEELPAARGSDEPHGRKRRRKRDKKKSKEADVSVDKDITKKGRRMRKRKKAREEEIVQGTTVQGSSGVSPSAGKTTRGISSTRRHNIGTAESGGGSSPRRRKRRSSGAGKK